MSCLAETPAKSLPLYTARDDHWNTTMWYRGKEGSEFVGISRDTLEHRAIPWQPQPVPFKVRFKLLVLDEGAEPVRRYYRPDLEALLLESYNDGAAVRLKPKWKG